jgi:hypothetical protein
MNPLTGRFMSRDPDDGHIRNPKSLHKYLYVAGDPINAADPTGRTSILEEGAIDVDLVSEVIHPLVKLGCTIEAGYAVEAKVAEVLAKWATGHEAEPLPEPPGWLDAVCGVVLGPDALKAIWDSFLEAKAGFALE